MVAIKFHLRLILALFMFTTLSLTGQENNCCVRRAIPGDCESGNSVVFLNESQQYRIQELLTSNCFHIVVSDVTIEGQALPTASKYHPPEYLFDAYYETGLNEFNTFDKYLLKSQLTLYLHYDGKSRGLVKSSSVKSHGESYSSCANLMPENNNALSGYSFVYLEKPPALD